MKKMVGEEIRAEVVEEADMIELQGGEIPEVAMFDALENLRLSDLQPTSAESGMLERAVVKRYRDIILRDLEPNNRERPEFRTPERAMINWRRLRNFAEINGTDIENIRLRAARMLIACLAVEAEEICGGKRFNTLGLSKAELLAFMDELDMNTSECRALAEAVTAVPTRKYGK